MKLKTVEELRNLRAQKSPLFSVEYLPYLDFFEKYPEHPDRNRSFGRLDDIYTTLPEATGRFAELLESGLVEELKMYQTVYGAHGGRSQRLIEEWDDPRRLNINVEEPMSNSQEVVVKKQDPQNLVRIQSELMHAREDYRFWTRQSHRLTRDEYAQKMKAEQRVRELESREKAYRQAYE